MGTPCVVIQTAVNQQAKPKYMQDKKVSYKTIFYHDSIQVKILKGNTCQYSLKKNGKLCNKIQLMVISRWQIKKKKHFPGFLIFFSNECISIISKQYIYNDFYQKYKKSYYMKTVSVQGLLLFMFYQKLKIQIVFKNALVSNSIGILRFEC